MLWKAARLRLSTYLHLFIIPNFCYYFHKCHEIYIFIYKHREQTDGPSTDIFKYRKRKASGKSLESSFKYSIADGLKVGTCKLCTEKVAIIKMKDSNTSGLRRHLKLFHPKDFEETYPTQKTTVAVIINTFYKHKFS